MPFHGALEIQARDRRSFFQPGHWDHVADAKSQVRAPLAHGQALRSLQKGAHVLCCCLMGHHRLDRQMGTRLSSANQLERVLRADILAALTASTIQAANAMARTMPLKSAKSFFSMNPSAIRNPHSSNPRRTAEVRAFVGPPHFDD